MGIIIAREGAVKMSDEPDHIFAYCWTRQNRSGQWHVQTGYSGAEYVRRDTIHQAALDRIAALEAEKATGWAVKVRPFEWRLMDNRWVAFAAGTETTVISEVAYVSKAWRDKAEADHIARVTALLEPADQSAIDAAVKAERERCAKIADERADKWGGKDAITRDICRRIAAAIRAGGEG